MTTLTRWNPFDDLFATLNTQSGQRQLAARSASWVPPVDISETDSAYLIELEIPAFALEDVTVEVKDSVLAISGERQRAADDEQRSHRLERRFGSFTRRFSLPEDANEEAIEATARLGVLQLTIAKREKATPRRIAIQGE